MQNYDILIAGGGGAGLGLAHALLQSPLKDASILIIEKDSKQHNDRTWCFWGGPETPFASIARHSWPKLVVESEDCHLIFDLSASPGGWRYWMVDGIDYYRSLRAELECAANINWLQGEVDEIRDGHDHALVTVNGETYSAKWVFDSIIRPRELVIDPQRYHNLKQHFKGWEIETTHPVFDPGCATLFDFSTPQKKDMRFFYVLPVSTTRALVEYTIFSAQLLSDEEYETALRDYIIANISSEPYRIIAEEQNSIPMSDFPFARRAGKRIMNIGTKGGMVKPSTGYAFQRMQRDAAAIVDSLVKNGHPFGVKPSPARYRLYDSILLQILFRQGEKMKPIFVQLFQRNPIRRVFRFLDEQASIFEDLALIASLPPGPFLRALFKIKILRKI